MSEAAITVPRASITPAAPAPTARTVTPHRSASDRTSAAAASAIAAPEDYYQIRGGIPNSQYFFKNDKVGNQYLFSGSWWLVVFPSLQLGLIVLSVNLLGDWLRDALNPKLR